MLAILCMYVIHSQVTRFKLDYIKKIKMFVFPISTKMLSLDGDKTIKSRRGMERAGRSAMVHTSKRIMMKARQSGSDSLLGLLTPSEQIGPSPAQLMFGRSPDAYMSAGSEHITTSHAEAQRGLMQRLGTCTITAVRRNDLLVMSARRSVRSLTSIRNGAKLKSPKSCLMNRILF
jgi:hypothetical protein